MKYIENTPKIKRSQGAGKFWNYQTYLKENKTAILEAMLDMTNYEMWVSSGIGCSVCNPFYHDKFNSMGSEGLYFDSRTYCKNFYKNSANYINVFRVLRLIQHNINFILKFMKASFEISDLATVEDETKFIEAAKKMMLKEGGKLKQWDNAQNLWKYGIKFGVEYSQVKKASTNVKVDSCIDEITKGVYPEECTMFCMETNPPNHITIATGRFVMNLIFAEFIIDRYWDLTNPNYFSDSVVLDYLKDLKNTSLKNVDLKDVKHDHDKEEMDDSSNFDVTKAKAKLRHMTNRYILKSTLGVFFLQHRLLEITDVFPPYKTSFKPQDYNYFINFEKLNSQATSYKAGWVPFPNSMIYQTIRVTYEGSGSIAGLGGVLLLVLLLLSWA